MNAKSADDKKYCNAGKTEPQRCKINQRRRRRIKIPKPSDPIQIAVTKLEVVESKNRKDGDRTSIIQDVKMLGLACLHSEISEGFFAMRRVCAGRPAASILNPGFPIDGQIRLLPNFIKNNFAKSNRFEV
jgi:hypothetical protein